MVSIDADLGASAGLMRVSNVGCTKLGRVRVPDMVVSQLSLLGSMPSRLGEHDR